MQSRHGSVPSRSHWLRRGVKKHRFLVFALALSTIPFSHAQIPPAAEMAELFLKNGKIFVDKTTGRQWEEAITTRDGIILSIGTTKALEKEVGPSTKVVDLKGKFVFPAFVDSNNSFMRGAWTLTRLQLTEATSIAQIQEKLKAYEQANPLKKWIVGWGIQTKNLREKRALNAADLDAALLDRPVLLWNKSFTTVFLNSKAIKILELEEDKNSYTGAEAEKFTQRIERPSLEEQKEAFLNAQRIANEQGIASIQGSFGFFGDSFSLEDQMKLLQDLWSEKKLSLRIALFGSLQSPEEYLRLKEKAGKELHEDWIRLSCVYEKVDGNLLEQAAALNEPYSNSPQTSGTPFFSQQQLNEKVLKANRLGASVCLSAQGDNAAGMAIGAIAKARRQLFNSRIRNQILDVWVVPKGSFGRFSDFGIVPSSNPSQLLEPALTEKELDALLGKVRVKNTLALKSFLKTQNHLSFASNWPEFPMNPFGGIFAAAYRHSPIKGPFRGWVPEQKISIEQAFEASTFGGAYSTHEDHVKGTLREGKYADMVVYDKNPFRVREKELLKIQPSLTIVGGKVVYDNSIPQLKEAR